MTAYYNENDPRAAAWLRELIREKHIADGDVDERSITDVQAQDLKDYTQHHFFAGIGGWSYALRLAGWPDDKPVWTGSCPCQPFSSAGKQLGSADARHLWPAWFGLIREFQPSILFGEQVARALSTGWYDLVAKDLEGAGYAVGAAVLPAVGVGAPHIRTRLWFVANTISGELRKQPGRSHGTHRESAVLTDSDGVAQPLADPNDAVGVQGRACNSAQESRGRDVDRGCERSDSMGNAHSSGLEKRQGEPSNPRQEFQTTERAGWWSTEPSMGRVANGIPGRAHLLRGYGNAIVPQVAQAFIEAYNQARS